MIGNATKFAARESQVEDLSATFDNHDAEIFESAQRLHKAEHMIASLLESDSANDIH
jgi:hypothetical protein